MELWSRRSGLDRLKQSVDLIARRLPRDAAWWVVLALLWIGLLLRARGMWLGRTISLWEDEAAWAMWLVDLPLKEHVLRSIGFMAVTKGLVSLFSESERVLRLLPWCAGVGALFVSPFLAKSLFRTQGARLLFVATIALHPAAIDLSKEFKPYSVALLLHLLVLLFVFRYATKLSENDLLAGIGTAFFGMLFSQDLVFTYPMVFGSMALVAYRERKRDHLFTVVAGAVFALGLLLAIRSNVVAKLGSADENVAYWGGKYSVFYLPAEGTSRVGWTAAKLAELASLPGGRRDLWHWSSISAEALATARRADSWVWIAVSAVGSGVLVWQKRYLVLTALTLPILTMSAFNYFGYWPLGAFRTNLFTIAYFSALAAFAVDWVKWPQPLAWQMVPMLSLVVLPFLTIGSASHSRKAAFTANAAFAPAAQALMELQGNHGRADVLVVDAPSCAPWRYYSHYHPGQPKRKELVRRFNSKCAKSLPSVLRHVREAVPRAGGRAFVLASGDETIAAIRKGLLDGFVIEQQRVIGRDDALVLKVTGATP